MSRGMIEDIKSSTEIPDILALQKALASDEDQTELFRLADATRKRVQGARVFVRGLLSFSNYDEKQRLYASYGEKMPAGELYHMSQEEIVQAAVEAARCYGTLLLRSGGDPVYTSELLVDIVKEIHTKTGAMLVLDVGERSPAAYAAMQEAGATCFLISWETAKTLADEELPGADDETDRLDKLKKRGFKIRGGFQVGTPGQTDALIAAEILLLRQTLTDLAEIELFEPPRHTELADYPAGDPQLALRAIALTRILLADAHIPAAGPLVKEGRLKDALTCGADAVLEQVTPARFRAPVSKMEDGAAGQSLEARYRELEETLRGLGLKPA